MLGASLNGVTDERLKGCKVLHPADQVPRDNSARGISKDEGLALPTCAAANEVGNKLFIITHYEML